MTDDRRGGPVAAAGGLFHVSWAVLSLTAYTVALVLCIRHFAGLKGDGSTCHAALKRWILIMLSCLMAGSLIRLCEWALHQVGMAACAWLYLCSVVSLLLSVFMLCFSLYGIRVIFVEPGCDPVGTRVATAVWAFEFVISTGPKLLLILLLVVASIVLLIAERNGYNPWLASTNENSRPQTPAPNYLKKKLQVVRFDALEPKKGTEPAAPPGGRSSQLRASSAFTIGRAVGRTNDNDEEDDDAKGAEEDYIDATYISTSPSGAADYWSRTSFRSGAAAARNSQVRGGQSAERVLTSANTSQEDLEAGASQRTVGGRTAEFPSSQATNRAAVLGEALREPLASLQALLGSSSSSQQQQLQQPPVATTANSSSSSCYCNPQEDLPACPICFCAFEPSDPVIRMPCDERHIFHQSCLFLWFDTSGTCPVCRRDLVDLFKTKEGSAGGPWWKRWRRRSAAAAGGGSSPPRHEDSRSVQLTGMMDVV